jgi:hypothetical protein
LVQEFHGRALAATLALSKADFLLCTTVLFQESYGVSRAKVVDQVLNAQFLESLQVKQLKSSNLEAFHPILYVLSCHCWIPNFGA